MCWFPQSFDLTQNDSIILSFGLLIAGCLCLFESKVKDGTKMRLQDHLLVHAAFGLYFLMRSDVLVGWIGVSVFLYWNRWKYLLIPLCFGLTIGATWGLYKKAHGSDFVMTTSSVGHVAFIGLWQTPSHKFVWEPSDESYAGWIGRHGYTYMEPQANAFAMREVVRFWFTYPGFVISNALYKTHAFFRANAWSGSLALSPSRAIGILMRRVVVWIFLSAIVAALIARFELRRTFILGWPIALNLPLFCLLQYNARYLPFVDCSVMFAAIPLLLDSRFYQRLSQSRRPIVALFILGTMLWLVAPVLSKRLSSDQFRYWPLLNPTYSTLNVLKP